MKNKGFTLIELIAVILILGAIALITLPIMNNVIKKGKEDMLKEQINRINDTAKKYVLEKLISTETSTESRDYLIKISDMVDAGYLANSDIKNPVTDSFMDGCVAVRYNSSNKKYKYEYMDECILNGVYKDAEKVVFQLIPYDYSNGINVADDIGTENMKKYNIPSDAKVYSSTGYGYLLDSKNEIKRIAGATVIKSNNLNYLRYTYDKLLKLLGANEILTYDNENGTIYYFNALNIPLPDPIKEPVQEYISNDFNYSGDGAFVLGVVNLDN